MDPETIPDWVKNSIVEVRLKPANIEDIKSACTTMREMFCTPVLPSEVRAYGRMAISNSRCVVYLDYTFGGAVVPLAVECWRSDRAHEAR